LPSLQYRVSAHKANTQTQYYKPHGKKIAANSPQAYCTEKFTICPTQFAAIILPLPTHRPILNLPNKAVILPLLFQN
jgi:hypothetical protein